MVFLQATFRPRDMRRTAVETTDPFSEGLGLVRRATKRSYQLERFA
jgi:hypothetical protein